MQLLEYAFGIIEEAKKAANPEGALKNSIKYNFSDNTIVINGKKFTIGRKIYLIAAGKAAPSMTEGLLNAIGDKIDKGFAVIPYGYRLENDKIKVFHAGHPVPDKNGEEGARTILEFVQKTDEEDLIIFLLSGGGSALLPLPRNGITLQDKIEITEILLASGANINEINAVRKHLSKIKGGNLAYHTKGALITLVLSDIPGDPLDSIASGPTVEDHTTFEDVQKIFSKYNLWNRIPQNIINLVKRGLEGVEEETPKKIPQRHSTKIIASNKTCVKAAVRKAKEIGFNTILLTTSLHGEAKEVAHVLSSIVIEIKKSMNPLDVPAAIIAGGETSVTVHGNGLGGRNQELALSFAIDIEGVHGIAMIAYATDGRDGPTDAAGASVVSGTAERAKAMGLQPELYLKNNDAYNFFNKLGALIKVGPTNTNVNDIILILVE